MGIKKSEMVFTCKGLEEFPPGTVRFKVTDAGLTVLVSDGEPWGSCGCEIINPKQARSLRKFLEENYPDV